ncbi:DUF1727 domain-containing protein [bacterium (Candidatus Howlettbacteria) CG_4_10_14_3_um_filter_37_10]|nr:MAG: hypothetical protein COX25_02065 [bacterium (Candidatus Howlettbacteria) CG23_combo_of_CG06-09_8_20_14_all_37_9]PIY00050.1 MAG: DUF1727 domain-containing protein [bacterium (Candidatus Howlettbacteria) CG_4_10_14_3_um_filter_37_10]PJB06690.1 MAG: DUF1727 domain-containing protein [bacterium (Candidatus Howlettbacteria) CG_4_9_14_3_um_filter_37_10]
MRLFIALLIGKFLMFLTRKTKKGGGTALPGLIALKIDPRLVKKITAKLQMGAILVTGTNGKTTTSKYIFEILRQAGFKVISNRAGSNLMRGVASTLIEESTIFGRPRGNIGLFEIDEAAMPDATKFLSPKIIIVNNLFRDQLDRYGELDKTAALISDSIKDLKNITLLLNADDPLVASLGKNVGSLTTVLYFGLEEDNYKASSLASFDSKDCLLCGQELIFDKRYYGHLGIYHCSNCKFARPEPDFIASGIEINGVKSAKANFSHANDILATQLKLSGIYNIYNALSAYAAAKVLDIDNNTIQQTLEVVAAAFGRMERVEVDDKEAYIMLIKNPIGFTQVIETLSTDPTSKDFFIALNDNFADGTDISWIWDADLESLSKDFKFIVSSGIRAADMTLRLKYTDLDAKKIETINNIPEAFEKALSLMGNNETLYVMPTYTAMFELRNYLKNKGVVLDFWEEQ